ncbi:MAG: alkaline phosphatase family protein [Deltaproteobacteria bacterium]|nr:alkaline phosphatase family protein [Deltaproteobacteria bacterium]
MKRLMTLGLCGLLAACVESGDDGTLREPATASTIKYVFVIAMENHDATQIYGNPDAPYINNTLLPAYGHALAFHDELPTGLPSEPHYVWMEAGTNAFADHTFTTDLPPGWFGNTTGSTAHLATQLTNAGVPWMSYQEDLNAMTGACPINDWWWYAAKHDPFVFFKDVSGATPSTSNAYCAAHHRPLTALAGDLASGAVASYAFITPNLCHDMHGAWFCPDSNGVRAGDAWLRDNLPPLIAFANAHHGVIFVTWDEGEGTSTMPFLAIGPGVKAGFASSDTLDHGSLLKATEQIFGLPILPTVQSSTDLGGFFAANQYP